MPKKLTTKGKATGVKGHPAGEKTAQYTTPGAKMGTRGAAKVGRPALPIRSAR